MNRQMNYSPLTPADLDAVTALEQRIQAFPWTPGNFRDSLAAGHEGWLDREAGAVAAYAVTMAVVDETHLLDIGVAPEFRRAGRGAALLGFLCDRARAAGMARMLLEVRCSNEAACAFYRRFDFAEIGRRRGYYPSHAGREDAIVMARPL